MKCDEDATAAEATASTTADPAAAEKLLIPDKPIDINIEANVNELMIDYNQLLTQLQAHENVIKERYSNIAKQIDSIRERVV